MQEAGFTISPGETPIVPVMLGDAHLATKFADELFNRNVYAVGFSYPVVPKGKARVRVQLSGVHTDDDVRKAIETFKSVGASLGVI